MLNAMDLIFTPFVVILVSVFIALFVLGPLVYGFEAQAVKLIGIPASAFWHRRDHRVHLSDSGYDQDAPHVHHDRNVAHRANRIQSADHGLRDVQLANAAVCLAIALRTNSAAIKTAGISATVTQMLGISEPALFGVVMRTGMKAIGVMLEFCSGRHGTFATGHPGEQLRIGSFVVSIDVYL